MEIYRYGKERSLWDGSTAIVANGSGSNFADALSASPVAFAEKAPIFIADESGRLPLEQQKALISGASDGNFWASGQPPPETTSTVPQESQPPSACLAEVS